VEPWELYLDESYNSATFAVGGFLAPAWRWRRIVSAWKARLDYESRKSAKKGYPPIKRYHATDCSNLKREFDEKKGWSRSRQIRLTKRLCEIIEDGMPSGIVVGGRLGDVRNHFGPDEKAAKEAIYDLCLRMILVIVAKEIGDRFSDAKVKVTYDQSKDFGRVAKSAYEMLVFDPGAQFLPNFFIGMEGGDSRTCIPLQPADFLVYEGMKQLDGIRRGNDEIRKSLVAVIGTEIPLFISQFTDQNFHSIRHMVENKRQGRPIEEGVEDGLAVAVNQ
jgi:hypothetical protein